MKLCTWRRHHPDLLELRLHLTSPPRATCGLETALVPVALTQRRWACDHLRRGEAAQLHVPFGVLAWVLGVMVSRRHSGGVSNIVAGIIFGPSARARLTGRSPRCPAFRTHATGMVAGLLVPLAHPQGLAAASSTSRSARSAVFWQI